MFNRILTGIFGSRNERLIKQMSKSVAKINALEPSLQALSDEDLRARTDALKARIAAGETVNDILPDAFATVREASRRVLGMRHYDVQLIGGMVLNSGRIAEMRTGEGKTLVATLPVYLNALEGKGVHVVTVNDYLARRDAAWMGKVYTFLGLTVGVVYPGMDHADKHAAYAADITYGTNNEYGFDYLRDNMALSKEQRYQRGLHYAIVDEVDSILIDEARTPLIISGPSDDSPQLYARINRIVPKLVRQEAEDGSGDYWVDEKQKQVHLSEEGMGHAEEVLRADGIIGTDESLYDSKHLAVVHHLNAALRANTLYRRDQEYIVRDGEVIIVDEFTGRTLAGRRWSDGLHQAVEAKEGVPIQRENQTLASITFQNYFRMYKKLSGMTGTADTEAYEFQQIYGLEVVVIPTHKAMVRKDNQDIVFLKQPYKFEAVIEDIKDCYTRGQPVLVGTTSIETSELLSNLLNKQKPPIPHEVLNAKQHEREAQIVAQAGRPAAVTIATNMAGRGTDIVLGGSLESELHALPEETTDADREALRADWKQRHEQVLNAGGLHIIGTERHESRRIDNQLRGRSGRQGDPGSSRFYLSLEDSLMRIFAPDWVTRWMQLFGMKEHEALEDKMITRVIEKSQRKVEAHNFDIRKNLLEFDDTSNDQRKVVYQQRNELLDANDVSENIVNIRYDVISDLVRRHVPADSVDEQWDLAGLDGALQSEFGIQLDVKHWAESQHDLSSDGIRDHVIDEVDRYFREKEAQYGSEIMRAAEKFFLLQVLDQHWKEHLASMDYLRQGIYLRGYAQKQPKQEYKSEGFALFQSMLERVKVEVIQRMSMLRIRNEEEVAALEEQQRREQERQALEFQHAEAASLAAPDAAVQADDGASAAQQGQIVRDAPKVGRNDPCPCGSGKKYKQCHGKLA
ncbi:MAG: preprotein translocase subunit SecA [Rudaea sp.]|nr:MULTISPECIES: preprotein translocase subunit SecA [unclassified Rudaea]MBN8887367.1 preprotein translocase subunit SecA [Rudaea sp.]